MGGRAGSWIILTQFSSCSTRKEGKRDMSRASGFRSPAKAEVENRQLSLSHIYHNKGRALWVDIVVSEGVSLWGTVEMKFISGMLHLKDGKRSK